MSRRAEVFLYQATSQPIVLGELPVVFPLVHQEHALVDPVPLIEGGSPFNHFIPEIFVTPCWIQDFSITPVRLDVVDDQQWIPRIIAAPEVYPDSYLPAGLQISGDRGLEISDPQWDPSAAAEIVEQDVPMDFLWHTDIEPLGFIPLDTVPLIVEVGGDPPLPEIPIIPHSGAPAEISPVDYELITDHYLPLFFATFVPMDWLSDAVVMPRDLDLLHGGAFPPTPVPVPDIIGWFDDVPYEGPAPIEEQYDSWFQSGVGIDEPQIVFKICDVRAEPVIGISSVAADPVIDAGSVDAQPVIGIDSVESESVC